MPNVSLKWLAQSRSHRESQLFSVLEKGKKESNSAECWGNDQDTAGGN